jgi:predicted amidohydrolase
MIIAAAQVRSAPGDVAANVSLHLAAIRQAANNGAGMVVFPELSLTGYEPSLADELAFEPLDERLQVFRDQSENLGITIGVGIPTKANGKPRISQAFFRPNSPDILYSKQRLHEDEMPFFQAGDEQACLMEDTETVVPAICYEALVPEHAAHAAELGATAYVACVAKPERGVTHAYTYFPESAKRNQFVVVMCNAIGRSDNFISVGRSAAWNRHGEILASAGSDAGCLMLVDLASERAKIEPLDRR